MFTVTIFDATLKTKLELPFILTNTTKEKNDPILEPCGLTVSFLDEKIKIICIDGNERFKQVRKDFMKQSDYFIIYADNLNAANGMLTEIQDEFKTTQPRIGFISNSPEALFNANNNFSFHIYNFKNSQERAGYKTLTVRNYTERQNYAFR